MSRIELVSSLIIIIIIIIILFSIKDMKWNAKVIVYLMLIILLFTLANARLGGVDLNFEIMSIHVLSTTR